MTVPDRIERSALLKVPRERAWRALVDHTQFGEWFKVKLDTPFVAGQPASGHITHPGYEHVKWEATIDRIEPEKRLRFRWRPYAIDPKRDYSAEPTTLVEFTLSDAPGGTQLTLVESGFDGVPESRRAEAFRMHEQGWTQQMANLRAYVEAQHSR